MVSCDDKFTASSGLWFLYLTNLVPPGVNWMSVLPIGYSFLSYSYSNHQYLLKRTVVVNSLTVSKVQLCSYPRGLKSQSPWTFYFFLSSVCTKARMWAGFPQSESSLEQMGLVLIWMVGGEGVGGVLRTPTLTLQWKLSLKSLNSLIWHNKLEKPAVPFGRLMECPHVRLISRNHLFSGGA